jgi:hypothetical protein
VVDVLRSVYRESFRLANDIAEAVEQAAFVWLWPGFDRLNRHGRSVREGVGGVENDDTVLNVAGQ